jgi:hypothetical protein
MLQRLLHHARESVYLFGRPPGGPAPPGTRARFLLHLCHHPHATTGGILRVMPREVNSARSTGCVPDGQTCEVSYAVVLVGDRCTLPPKKKPQRSRSPPTATANSLDKTVTLESPTCEAALSVGCWGPRIDSKSPNKWGLQPALRGAGRLRTGPGSHPAWRGAASGCRDRMGQIGVRSRSGSCRGPGPAAGGDPARQ